MALSGRLVDAAFGGGNLVVSTAGVGANELLVALVDTDAGGGPPAPSGWTIRATAEADSGSDTSWALVKDALGPGDPSYTFAIGGGADGAVHLVAIAATSGTPQWDDAAATGVAPSISTAMVAPSVTAVETTALLLCCWTLYSGTSPGSITPPGDMDEVVDNVQSNGWGYRSIYTEQVGAGATGTRTATASATFGHNSISVAFSETGGAAPVPGVAASSLGGLSASAAGKRVVHGSASSVLGPLSGSGSGKRAVAGTAAANLRELNGSTSGRRSVFGAANATMAALDGRATGRRIITGTAEGAFAPLDATAAGRRTVAGNLAGNLAQLDAAAQGRRTVHGAAAAELGLLDGEAVESGVTPGVAAADFAPLGAAASGRRRVHGTATASFGALSALAQGTVAEVVTGVAAADLAPLAAVGRGSRTAHGMASASFAPLDAVADGAPSAAGPLITVSVSTRSTTGATGVRSTTAEVIVW